MRIFVGVRFVVPLAAHFTTVSLDVYVYKPINGLCSVDGQLLLIYGKIWLATNSSGGPPQVPLPRGLTIPHSLVIVICHACRTLFKGLCYTL